MLSAKEARKIADAVNAREDIMFIVKDILKSIKIKAEAGKKSYWIARDAFNNTVECNAVVHELTLLGYGITTAVSVIHLSNRVADDTAKIGFDIKW